MRDLKDIDAPTMTSAMDTEHVRNMDGVKDSLSPERMPHISTTKARQEANARLINSIPRMLMFSSMTITATDGDIAPIKISAPVGKQDHPKMAHTATMKVLQVFDVRPIRQNPATPPGITIAKDRGLVQPGAGARDSCDGPKCHLLLR